MGEIKVSCLKIAKKVFSVLETLKTLRARSAQSIKHRNEIICHLGVHASRAGDEKCSTSIHTTLILLLILRKRDFTF